ncbi:aspartate/glutamate racemase family protein [Streptomyces sp. RPT161]|uniref:aspartate/glutamate racemase family protein n=1 Tax=Streptomyces sp. RPT161 TaxID=3015993 RepID=UPI0022B8FE19|nr:aspartate/glutamate racemase family protein [Streptomyces sp. RPT161]
MLALLHTSSVHIPVFDTLRDRKHPGLSLRHIVSEELLTRARTDGPNAVARDIDHALASAVAEGAAAVLCTCSAIGGVAETRAAALGVPVLRIDRPMAAAAATVAPGENRIATHIVVIAALASTVSPTVALIEEEATQSGRSVTVTATVVDGAWDRFEGGDQAGYLTAIATAVEAVDDADVIVLAQASMADAANQTMTAIPVLSSPALGLRAAAAAAS